MSIRQFMREIRESNERDMEAAFSIKREISRMNFAPDDRDGVENGK